MPNDQQNINQDEAELSEAPVAPVEESASECPNCAVVKAEAAEYKQGWQRAIADYQNLQKETRERRQEWLEMSELQILEEFIPVYDNFRKAWNVERGTFGPEVQNWIKGVEYIKKQFGDILKTHKIEEIKTVGEKFDPKFHETIGEEEDEQESGTILREIDGGYTMGGRVIKAAKVVIAK